MRPTDEFTVEMLHQLSADAADMEDYQTSLDWLALALRLAPTSARLWAERAYAHEQLAQLDEAEAAYQKAVEFDTSGEAHFLYARFAHLWGRRDVAVKMLVRACELEPTFGIELEVDGEDWGSLPQDPAVRRAMRRALDRCS